jgi:hypothetical protein
LVFFFLFFFNFFVNLLIFSEEKIERDKQRTSFLSSDESFEDISKKKNKEEELRKIKEEEEMEKERIKREEEERERRKKMEEEEDEKDMEELNRLETEYLQADENLSDSSSSSSSNFSSFSSYDSEDVFFLFNLVNEIYYIINKLKDESDSDDSSEERNRKRKRRKKWKNQLEKKKQKKELKIKKIEEREIKKIDMDKKKKLFIRKKEERYRKLQRRMNEEELMKNSFSLLINTGTNIKEEKKKISGKDVYIPHKLMSILEKSQRVSSLIPTALSDYSIFEPSDQEIYSTQLKYAETVNDDHLDYDVDHFKKMMNELSPYIVAEQGVLKSFNFSSNSSTPPEDLIYEAVCLELENQYSDIPDLLENNVFEELLLYKKREIETMYLTTASLVEVDFGIEEKTKAVFESLIDLENEENGGKLERKRSSFASLFNSLSLFDPLDFFKKISYNHSFLSLPSTRTSKTNQSFHKNSNFNSISPSKNLGVRDYVDIIISSLIRELKDAINKKEFIYFII